MAHEITSTDHVVLAGQAAWHGLGTLVENAPTPSEALKLARMDWTVEQWPLVAHGPAGEQNAVEKNVINIRSDTKEQLGIVGKGWVPFQNAEMADFANALAEQGDTVKVETAGSIRSGAKVWFLLRGESFTVRTRDEVKPYILLSNGFDGNTSFRATPTSIRVVCSNTLHAVIPTREGGRSRYAEAGFVISHTKSLKDRVEECKKVLGLYGKALDKQKEMITALAAKEVSNDAVKRFFLECYSRDFGAFADAPTNKAEITARQKAIDASLACMFRFTEEMDLAGHTAWNAMNAYTGWLQNDRGSNRKDEVAANDADVTSTLFAVNSKRTIAAFQAALAL
jgi:phage/plasmid-like protein (TIGR03299 family)